MVTSAVWKRRIPNRSGSAPAPGAVFRALAENPDSPESFQRPSQRHAQPPAARAPPATPGAGVLPNFGVD
jgi:hypothetical protein